MGPSPWVRRFLALVPNIEGSRVLDLACGGGRHTRLFLDAGYDVLAVDRDVSGLADPSPTPRLKLMETDLEGSGGWPLKGEMFEGIVVTNYLFRPILSDIVGAVAPGGVLLYETFAQGNERFGRPRNPDFLLREGELLETVKGELAVVAYEHGEISEPKPAMVQRIAAIRLQQDQSMPTVDTA